jgi:hypothetical protein
MALSALDTVGNGYISEMTDDFCTYEIVQFPISASGLQKFLDDGWEQMGSHVVTRDPSSGHAVYNYNFRNILNA